MLYTVTTVIAIIIEYGINTRSDLARRNGLSQAYVKGETKIGVPEINTFIMSFSVVAILGIVN